MSENLDENARDSAAPDQLSDRTGLIKKGIFCPNCGGNNFEFKRYEHGVALKCRNCSVPRAGTQIERLL